jgi:hypothetical protein
MKVQISNGENLGTAEWMSPGRVEVQVEDPRQREFFEAYFTSEDSFLSGPVESAEMTAERPDESEEAFARAAFRLAAHAYRVKEASHSSESAT